MASLGNNQIKSTFILLDMPNVKFTTGGIQGKALEVAGNSSSTFQDLEFDGSLQPLYTC